MINYSIPADFNLETINRIEILNSQYENSKITETYGQISVDNIYGSGRANDLIPQVDRHNLEAYVNYLHKRNLQFNYTLNTTCLANNEFTEEGLEHLRSFIHWIENIGITTITVAMPSLIQIIRHFSKNLKIKASTVCQITNANKAVMFQSIGASRMVVDETINRDFTTLRNIRNAFGNGVELIVNVICHKNCIFEMFHHNQTSHDNHSNKENPSVSYYSHMCMLQRCDRPSTLLKLNWIRPEDISLYVRETGIDQFKIQGRQAALSGQILKTTEFYMKQSYSGNLMQLLDSFSPTNRFQVFLDNKSLDHFIEPFYKNENFCKNNCTSCGYCDKYISRCADTKAVQTVFNSACMFYKSYVTYLLNQITKTENIND